jgi:mRNA interferase MazF
MERFIKGDIVVVAFPFSGMRDTKRRPAVIVAELEGNEVLICNVTSSRFDRYSIDLTNDDLEEGLLRLKSRIRPNILFIMENRDIVRKIGHLKDSKIKEVEDKLVRIITD